MVLKRTLGTRKVREIQATIDRRLYFWERGIHAGLVGDALAEERVREGHTKRRDEEEENYLVRSFHITLLLGKLQQAVRWSTDFEA